MSRKAKNILLITSNLLFAIILLIKANLYDFSLDNYLCLWLFFCPIVLMLHLLNIDNSKFIQFRDALLFLLTGGSIGWTLGEILNSNFDSILIVWLVFGILTAIIHYTPSTKDRYLN